MEISLILLAAGSGARVEIEQKKQWLRSGAKPFWCLALENLLKSYDFSEVIVVGENKMRDFIDNIEPGFACKNPGTFGKCMCRDGLSDVLEKIRRADGLIIGSPNYLGNLTAGFRALYERLVFQSLTYNKETPCYNEHMIPVLLIMTSNCPEEAYQAEGYRALLDSYQKTLSRFVGPTEVLACGNTLQVNDYSQYSWTIFDPEEKKKQIKYCNN